MSHWDDEDCEHAEEVRKGYETRIEELETALADAITQLLGIKAYLNLESINRLKELLNKE